MINKNQNKTTVQMLKKIHNASLSASKTLQIIEDMVYKIEENNTSEDIHLVLENVMNRYVEIDNSLNTIENVINETIKTSNKQH